jgi:hypothetical protein
MVTAARPPIVVARHIALAEGTRTMKKISLAVPTIVAIIGVAVVSRVTAPLPPAALEVSSHPTVYSQDHARVQSLPGEAEPLPPTF